MGRGQRLPELTLTVEENNRLAEWTRRRKSAQALALRAGIVLACAQGELNGDVARRLRVTSQTVGKWWQRFVDQRLDGLLDAPRPGQPRKISDAQVEQVIALTLGEPAGGRDALEHAAMAKAARLNQTAASRIATKRSSCPPIRCSSTRCVTSSVCIWHRPLVLWSCVSMRNLKSRHWTVRSRCCRCRLA